MALAICHADHSAFFLGRASSHAWPVAPSGYGTGRKSLANHEFPMPTAGRISARFLVIRSKKGSLIAICIGIVSLWQACAGQNGIGAGVCTS